MLDRIFVLLHQVGVAGFPESRDFDFFPNAIKLDTFVRIVNALNLSSDALFQDVVVPVTDSIMAELSARIGRLPQKEQDRILNAIRALTE